MIGRDGIDDWRRGCGALIDCWLLTTTRQIADIHLLTRFDFLFDLLLLLESFQESRLQPRRVLCFELLLYIL